MFSDNSSIFVSSKWWPVSTCSYTVCCVVRTVCYPSILYIYSIKLNWKVDSRAGIECNWIICSLHWQYDWWLAATVAYSFAWMHHLFMVPGTIDLMSCRKKCVSSWNLYLHLPVFRIICIVTCECSDISDVTRSDDNSSVVADTSHWHQTNIVTVVVARVAVIETRWRRPCDTSRAKTCSTINAVNVYVFLSFSWLSAKWS